MWAEVLVGVLPICYIMMVGGAHYAMPKMPCRNAGRRKILPILRNETGAGKAESFEAC